MTGFGVPLNPGLLRHRIQVFAPADVPPGNTFNEPTAARSLVATTWANIQALQGRELQAVQQTFADARFRIETQYLAGITTAMQILDDEGRTLNVLDVQDPYGIRDRLVIYASEVK